MRTTLVALSVGLAMFSGAGIAQAASVADPGAPIGPTAGQSKVVIAGQVRATGPMVLTDSQMDELTAGHKWNGSWNHSSWRTGWFHIHFHGKDYYVKGSHKKEHYYFN